MEMNEEKNLGREHASRPDGDEISLLDLALVLAEQKKFILGLTALAAVASLIASLLMTPLFKSTTRLMPPQQSQSAASAMLGQLTGGGGGGGGVAAALGLKNPADLHIGILKSRTLSDAIIQRFDLKNYYEQESKDGARKMLAASTGFAAGKDGILTIDVWDKDPKRASDMANAYVEELEKLQSGLAITEAAQRRVYYERQLKYAADKLAESQVALRRSLDEGGIVMPDAQGQALVATVSSLRAQISAKEIEVRAMRAFATENNPDLKKLQQQLASMRQELAKLEGGVRLSKGAEGGNHAETDLGSVQRMQDVKYYQVLFEQMAKQYELARLDESKDSIVIQVIDRAEEAERKDKPKRASFVMVSTLAAFFLAVILVFAWNAFAKVNSNPEVAGRLKRLKSTLFS